MNTILLVFTILPVLPVSEQKEKPGWNFNVEEKEAGNQTPLKAN